MAAREHAGMLRSRVITSGGGWRPLVTGGGDLYSLKGKPEISLGVLGRAGLSEPAVEH